MEHTVRQVDSRFNVPDVLRLTQCKSVNEKTVILGGIL